MASPTQWTWVWVNSGSWWWTGRPGVPCSSWGCKESDTTERLNWTLSWPNYVPEFPPPEYYHIRGVGFCVWIFRGHKHLVFGTYRKQRHQYTRDGLPFNSRCAFYYRPSKIFLDYSRIMLLLRIFNYFLKIIKISIPVRLTQHSSVNFFLMWIYIKVNSLKGKQLDNS